MYIPQRIKNEEHIPRKTMNYEEHIPQRKLKPRDPVPQSNVQVILNFKSLEVRLDYKIVTILMEGTTLRGAYSAEQEAGTSGSKMANDSSKRWCLKTPEEKKKIAAKLIS